MAKEEELKDWLSGRLDKIEEKQDRLYEVQGHMNITLAVQSTQLAHHIKRTDLAEEAIKDAKEHADKAITEAKEHAEKATKAAKAAADAELDPIRKWVSFQQSIIKFLLGCAAVTAAALGVLKYLGKF